jgi:hypothetical protein
MGMLEWWGISVLGGTADRRPAVDPTALPIAELPLSIFQYSIIPVFLKLFSGP